MLVVSFPRICISTQYNLLIEIYRWDVPQIHTKVSDEQLDILVLDTIYMVGSEDGSVGKMFATKS